MSRPFADRMQTWAPLLLSVLFACESSASGSPDAQVRTGDASMSDASALDASDAAMGARDSGSTGSAMDAGDAMSASDASRDASVPRVGWSSPTRLDAPDGLSSEPKLSIDGQGNVHALWFTQTGPGPIGSQLYANRFDEESRTWSGAQPIVSLPAQHARFPVVCSLSSGSAVAAYAYDEDALGTGTPARLSALYFDAGAATWSGRIEVQSGNPRDVARSRSLACAGDGAAAAFLQDNQAYWSASTNGTTWSTPSAIELAGTDLDDEPRVVFDASGALLAAYRRYDTDNTLVVATKASDEAVFASPETLSQPSAFARFIGPLVSHESGAVLVVWVDILSADPLVQKVVASLRTAGVWSTSDVSADNTGQQVFPDATFDSDGVPVVVWARERADGTSYEVAAARFEMGAWTAHETLSSAPSTKGVGNPGPPQPQIAAGSDGQLFVVWEQHDGANVVVVSNRRVEGAFVGATPLESVGTASALDVNHAQTDVVVDAAGHATAIWATSGNVFVSRYTP